MESGTEKSRSFLPQSPQWVDEVVGHHTPSEEGLRRIAAIRLAAAVMMKAIIKNCPDCEDRAVAIRHVR